MELEDWGSDGGITYIQHTGENLCNWKLCRSVDRASKYIVPLVNSKNIVNRHSRWLWCYSSVNVALRLRMIQGKGSLKSCD
jgi:hypothetical protein